MNAKIVVENVRRIVSLLDISYEVREAIEGLIGFIAEAVADSDRVITCLENAANDYVRTIQDLRDDLTDSREHVADLQRERGTESTTGLQLRVNGLETAVRNLRYENQALTEKLNLANEKLSKFYMGNTDELETKIRAFMADNPGKKIQAIKETRSLTNWGLKESKEYVEYLDSHLSGHPAIV